MYRFLDGRDGERAVQRREEHERDSAVLGRHVDGVPRLIAGFFVSHHHRSRIRIRCRPARPATTTSLQCHSISFSSVAALLHAHSSPQP